MHEEKNDLTEAEKLSGFSKKDKLIPVITLCICFDKKKWDAPRSLYDMFGEIDPKLAEYINDYKLNLITPDEIEDFSKFSSELGTIMELIHYSDDKERARDIMKSEDDRLIQTKTAEMIQVFTGINVTKYKTEGGQVMVKNAYMEILEDERNEGRIEGRIEGRVLARYEDGMSIEDIATKCKISVDKVKEIIANSTVTT